MYRSGRFKQELGRAQPKKWRRTEIAVPYVGSADAVGRHTIVFQIEMCSARLLEAPAFAGRTFLSVRLERERSALAARQERIPSHVDERCNPWRKIHAGV
jgi:hypothetical protein